MDLNEIKATISQIEIDFRVRTALFENAKCNQYSIIRYIKSKLKTLENLIAEEKKYKENYGLDLYKEMEAFCKKASKLNNLINS